MSVLINMEMPKEPDEMIEIAIFGDGKVIQTGESWRNLENGKCYYTPTTPEKFFKAVPVPPHGRLGDLDALCERLRSLAENEYTPEVFANWIENHIDAIIPASEEET